MAQRDASLAVGGQLEIRRRVANAQMFDHFALVCANFIGKVAPNPFCGAHASD
jgi:hypothetical protein